MKFCIYAVWAFPKKTQFMCYVENIIRSLRFFSFSFSEPRAEVSVTIPNFPFLSSNSGAGAGARAPGDTQRVVCGCVCPSLLYLIIQFRLKFCLCSLVRNNPTGNLLQRKLPLMSNCKKLPQIHWVSIEHAATL